MRNVPEGQSQMAFERFWRGDTARTGDGSHFGLGLSLVRRAAAVLGGSVQISTAAGGWFEIVSTIPGKDAAVSADGDPS